MSLTRDQIAHVAMLARLGLDDAEQERIGGQLSAILDHISRLQEIDTSHVVETAQVGTLVNVWREDRPEPSIGADKALANAPESDGSYFVVGAIQAEGGDTE